MTTDDARRMYRLMVALAARPHRCWRSQPCAVTLRRHRRVDAASVALDMAVSEAHNAWSGPSERQARYVYP